MIEVMSAQNLKTDSVNQLEEDEPPWARKEPIFVLCTFSGRAGISGVVGAKPPIIMIVGL